MAVPQVSPPGRIEAAYPGDELADDLIEAVRGAVARVPDNAPEDGIAEAARRAVRKLVNQRLGKKPVAQIHVVRV
ncbi:MAG: hypothetical protein IBJ15_17925 [Alphaproteobacteria bacterium]|nr:hypothetical protein [Alphaproteobacteria bacterium]